MADLFRVLAHSLPPSSFSVSSDLFTLFFISINQQHKVMEHQNSDLFLIQMAMLSLRHIRFMFLICHQLLTEFYCFTNSDLTCRNSVQHVATTILIGQWVNMRRRALSIAHLWSDCVRRFVHFDSVQMFSFRFLALFFTRFFSLLLGGKIKPNEAQIRINT